MNNQNIHPPIRNENKYLDQCLHSTDMDVVQLDRTNLNQNLQPSPMNQIQLYKEQKYLNHN